LRLIALAMLHRAHAHAPPWMFMSSPAFTIPSPQVFCCLESTVALFIYPAAPSPRSESKSYASHPQAPQIRLNGSKLRPKVTNSLNEKPESYIEARLHVHASTTDLTCRALFLMQARIVVEPRFSLVVASFGGRRGVHRHFARLSPSAYRDISLHWSFTRASIPHIALDKPKSRTPIK
jgi:hypothetical protein